MIFLLSMKVWAYTVEFAFACRWYMSGVLLWSEISWMIYRIVNLSTCGFIVGIEIRMNSFWFYLYLKLSNPDKMSSDFGCDSLCSWWDFKKCIKAELSIMSAIENYYVIEQWLVSPSTKWKFDKNQPCQLKTERDRDSCLLFVKPSLLKNISFKPYISDSACRREICLF